MPDVAGALAFIEHRLRNIGSDTAEAVTLKMLKEYLTP